MSLEKEILLDQIQISSNNVVQAKFVVSIYENDEKISVADLYKTFAPGADCSQEDAKVQAICATVHTQEVIAAYKAAQETAGA